jgi:hypothetical protein
MFVKVLNKRDPFSIKKEPQKKTFICLEHLTQLLGIYKNYFFKKINLKKKPNVQNWTKSYSIRPAAAHNSCTLDALQMLFHSSLTLIAAYGHPQLNRLQAKLDHHPLPTS